MITQVQVGINTIYTATAAQVDIDSTDCSDLTPATGLQQWQCHTAGMSEYLGISICTNTRYLQCPNCPDTGYLQ